MLVNIKVKAKGWVYSHYDNCYIIMHVGGANNYGYMSLTLAKNVLLTLGNNVICITLMEREENCPKNVLLTLA